MNGFQDQAMLGNARNANPIIGTENGELKFLIKSKKYGSFSVLVDEEEWEKIKTFRWIISKKQEKDYFYVSAMTKSYKGKRSKIILSRLIMGFPEGKVVDHANHNTFDNRKANLRACTIQENRFNSLSQKNSKSKYKGVHPHKRDNCFEVSIQKDGKDYYLGRFKDEKEAAIFYNQEAPKYHGEFAKLNIIGD